MRQLEAHTSLSPRVVAKIQRSRLVVIGVHTPEFSFEHNVDNIRWALKDMRIEYPVAVDSSYAIWRAFDNQFWPASYFIDAKGHIRHHQFGEGEYLQGEAVIQQLLTEAGFAGFNREPAPVSPYGPEVGADLGNLRSSETYVGYEQTKNFASPHGAAWNKARTYSFPARLDLNSWAVAGNWTAGKEAVALNQSGGRIAYQFHARDLNLVMGPTVQGKPVRFRLTNRSDCVRVAMVATTFHAGRSRYSAAVVSIVVIRILLVGCALRLAPPRRVSGHRSEKATFHPSGKYPLKISEHWRVFQYRFWFSGANRGQCVRWSEIVG